MEARTRNRVIAFRVTPAERRKIEAKSGSRDYASRNICSTPPWKRLSLWWRT